MSRYRRPERPHVTTTETSHWLGGPNSLYKLESYSTAIVNMEGEYETVHKLSNGAISNDLE